MMLRVMCGQHVVALAAEDGPVYANPVHRSEPDGRQPDERGLWEIDLSNLGCSKESAGGEWCGESWTISAVEQS